MKRKVLVWGWALTLGAAALPARAEQVVFSEIMYHPPAGQPEYLEVQNLTATVFDIANWRLTGGARYTFPDFSSANPDRTFLRPFERILLSSADPATTRAAYGIPAEARIFGPWEGRLSNDGERITLQDQNRVVLCSVAYGDRGHWSPAADGAGHSLVLIHPDRGADNWRHWRASARRGGTPGTAPITATEEPIPNPEVREETGLVLLDYNQVWRYNDRAVDLGTAWREPAYNDADWPSGPGILGWENSSLPAPGLQTEVHKGNQLTYYFRTTFTYDGPLEDVTLEVDQIVDDGVVYWLNGQELGRVRVASGPVDFNTRSSSTVSNATEEKAVLRVPASALKAGENVLAAEVHQTNPNSSDIVFAARLRALIPVLQAEGLVLNEIRPGPAGEGFIEVFNPTDAPVNLQGHYLSNNGADLAQHRITEDLVVAPGALAVVGFAENGFPLRNPVTVYLVAPDGESVLNAIRADIPLDGRSIGRKPAGGDDWFRFAEPTRAAPNGGSDAARRALALNEAHFSATNTVDWVEIYNRGADALPLNGFFVASRPDLSDAVPLAGSVAPGGFAVVATAFPLDGNETRLFLVAAGDTVLDARVLNRPKKRDSLQAWPDGGKEWYSAETPTRAAPNDPPRETRVVINEIMCDPPSNLVDGEFIELYNRGAEPVDVGGWRLEEGVRFRIPDGTTIPAGGFLVIAANAEWMSRTYGKIPVVGNYQGRLDNEGELLQLRDQWGNLADEVDYHIGGDWPDLAGGMGSSLELRHPDMDNNAATAWRASNESQKGPWREFRYQGVYKETKRFGAASDYREIYFHLVGDAHVILTDLALVRTSDQRNILENINQLSPNNRGADGWLIQGTHWPSYSDGRALHLISTGRGDNRANRAEIDVPQLTRNTEYELRFKARWVYGNPRLVFSTFDHSIATSFLLEIPSRLGTPGRPNSSRLPLPAPTVAGLRHQPAVPRGSDPVVITARVQAPGGAPQVTLYHRQDNADGDAPWQTTPMWDDGSHGDETAGDGLYTARLTQYQSDGQIVQFYVEAKANNGEKTVLPKWGEQRPALYVVDNDVAPRDLRVARFVVSAYDLGAISNGESSKYHYKFPRLSNQYRNATFISNERDIFYNAEIRNSGSPWTRGKNLDRGKFKLPTDRRFRGHRKFFFDNDPTANRLFNNRMARYLLYRVGHPASENEFIYVIINAGRPRLREDTEPVGNDMLDRLFANGNAGNLYKIDDEWWFKDNWDRQNRNADWNYKGTDNAGRYRTEWMKRTNEDEDDYSDLITFFKTVSRRYSEQEAARLIDVDATMQMFAVRGYIDDWDSISLRRGKNGYMYRRPDDGLFQFLHWDSDLTFGDSGANFYGNLPKVGTWIRKPLNLRVFQYYLAELVEQHTKDSARTLAWLDAEEAASSGYSINKSKFVSWFNRRNGPARSVMGSNYTRSFQVLDHQTEADGSLTITGVSPTGVYGIAVEGHPEAQLTWTSISAWRITDVRLPQGEHQLSLIPVDRHGRPAVHLGNPMTPATLSVTIAENPPPLAALDAAPASWHVAVGESLELDARASRDPDGAPVSFDWQLQPAPSQWEPLAPGRARARFARPGVYTIRLSVSDPAGGTTSLVREAAVYGPQGFSSFGGRLLDDCWRLDHVTPRENYFAGDWLALDVMDGHLVLQTLDDDPRPLAEAPRVWRALPATPEWTFETRLKLVTRRFGDFLSGLGVEIQQSGEESRVAFGVLNGNRLGVRRATLDGASEETLFAGGIMTKNAATLRARRDAEGIHFAWRPNGVWESLYTLPLDAAAETPAVGLLTETTRPQATQVAFDYALLADPAAVSPLQGNLILSELMYNPPDGSDYEFLELANIGSTPLDLTGARFTDGVDYTFGNTLLQPGELIVVAKNPSAFTERYGSEGIRLAAGAYEGKLSNAGEKITLVDADGQEVFSFRYGDSGNWPGRADGRGSSLERAVPEGDPGKASSWAASTLIGGSPGQLRSPAPPPVIINELLAHSDPPFEDAIELYNRGNTPVDLGGWFISDDPDELTRFEIPAGTVIGPRGYLVFYENQFHTNNVRVPFSFSSVYGDEALLVAGDGAGHPTAFVDGVSFGPSLNAVPFGRWPNGDGGAPFIPLDHQTFGTTLQPWDPPAAIDLFRRGKGAPNAAPWISPVVLTEIMYHPPEGGDEFLELYNRTDAPVPLFDPLASTNHWRFTKGIQFEFPAQTTLAARERVLLCGIDPALFRARHNIPAETRIFGPWTGNLDNAGEAVDLSKPDAPQTHGEIGYVPYVVVERVRYDNNLPWPPEADGDGPSLVRVNPDQYGDDPANWTASNLPPDLDSDGDGMPDVWELAHQLDPANPGDAGGDPDQDGMRNLDEYYAGTNPRSAESRLQFDGLTLTADGVELRFQAAADRAYRIEYRDQAADGAWRSLAEIPAGAAREVVAEDPVNTNATRFYRLILTTTP